MKTAQEAYEQAIKGFEDVDIANAMNVAEESIEKAIESKSLCTLIGPFSPVIGEKVAIELEKLGYYASAHFSGKYSENAMPLVNISINFKYLPTPSRESYK